MRKYLVIPALALVVAVTMPGIAAAQFTCPVPATFTDNGFDASEIAQAGLDNPLTGEATAGIFPGQGDGYNDFFDPDDGETLADGIAEARSEIPLIVLSTLIETVISDPDFNDIQGQSIQVHDVVCDAFVTNANILDPVTICSSLAAFFDSTTQGGTSKVSGGTIAWAADEAGVQDVLDVGYDANLDGTSPCPEQPDTGVFTTLGGAGNLLGDAGDIDGDAIDNLTEWETAVDNNSTTSDDFGAALAEFVATALAGTEITVSVSGPGEVLSGFGGTFSAVTVDPMDPMFSETHTFTSSNSSVLEHLGGGLFMGKNKGTAQVIATGDTSGAVGTRTVSVRFADWDEVCTIDESLTGDFGGLISVAGCLITGGAAGAFGGPVTNIATDVDLDNDGVKELNGLTALAYTLCDGAIGPDAAAVAASYATNQMVIDNTISDLQSLDAWLNGDGGTTVDISPNGGFIDVTGAPSGEMLQLSAETTGNDAGETHSWNSLTPGVATVDGAGLVTAAMAGSTVIEATGDTSGITDMVTVTVFDLTTDNRVDVSGEADICDDVAGIQLTATTTGADSGETYTWMEDSAGSVLTVDASGFVIPVMAGEATVTATGDDSGESDSVDIEVFGCEVPCDTPGAGKATTVNNSGQLFHTANLIALYNTGGGQAEAIALSADGALDPLLSDAIVAPPPVPFEGLLPNAELLLDGINELVDGLLQFEDVTTGLAAMAGLTAELDGFTQGVLDGTGLLPSGNELGVFVNAASGAAPALAISDYTDLIAGIGLTLDAIEAGAGMDLFPDLGAPVLDSIQETHVPAALADLGTFSATWTDPDFDVYIDPFFKAAGIDPYGGGNVFAPGVNPIDLANEDAEDITENNGGDNFDYVNLITGQNPLSTPGNPFLPVGGALVMGILAGGLAALGARRLRRG